LHNLALFCRPCHYCSIWILLFWIRWTTFFSVTLPQSNIIHRTIVVSLITSDILLPFSCTVYTTAIVICWVQYSNFGSKSPSSHTSLMFSQGFNVLSSRNSIFIVEDEERNSLNSYILRHFDIFFNGFSISIWM
jgi:hypothetical protein